MRTNNRMRSVRKKRRSSFLVALLYGVSLCWSGTTVADVSILYAGVLMPSLAAATLRVRLSGRIGPDDVVTIGSALKRLKATTAKPIVIMATLGSPGGDVKAALQLGRLLREHDGLATVEAEDVCASACVFVLAGGVARITSGSVQIHRPYDPNDHLVTPADQKKKYAALRAEVGAFLGEMNISISLYEDMLRIPARFKSGYHSDTVLAGFLSAT